MHEMYLLAWQVGLKTTYYLRTLAATQVEKSTIDVNRFGIQPKWMKSRSSSSDIEVSREESPIAVGETIAAGETRAAGEAIAQCRLDDPTCEACQ
jgi:ribonucleoside-diphosphate reductase alpha chain